MKVFFVSFGCDKNKVDSEKILKLLFNTVNDVELVEFENEADCIIVNTCAFIKDAKDESENYINYLVNLKKAKDSKLKKIFVLGCLAKEYELTNKKFSSEIDIVFPIEKYIEDIDNKHERVSDILSFSSSIKISEGCDKSCSYCIIPKLRGKFRSREISDILVEAKDLADNGVRELNIVAQDTLSYGKDLYNEVRIVDLIENISMIKGIEYIRFLYCYPEEITDEFIKLIKNNKKVVHYIDMPLQHINNKILKSMHRATNKEDITKTIKKIREEIPDIALRTTFIVGFPGETEEDFDELCEFVKVIKFDKLGVFTYSREKLSDSYDYENQIDEDIKNERREKLLSIQEEIVKDINKNRLGKIYKAIVEGYDTNEKAYIVRSYFDAREIDDVIFVKTNKKLISGDFIDVKINNVRGYDLEGDLIKIY